MTRALAARAATLIALAGPAAADGFSIAGLGPAPSREACLGRAEEMLDACVESLGAEDVATGDWAT